VVRKALMPRFLAGAGLYWAGDVRRCRNWPARDTSKTRDNCMSTPRPRRPRPQVMKLTERAAERIKALIADQGVGAIGLRLGIKKGGCAGMEYTMSWATAQDPLDEVVETHGVKVLIDPMAVMYLLGTEMDYRTDKLAAQFVFSNPNQTSACGCGESVNLAPAGAEKLEGLRA
jgi:iron-sulfur cluster assembly protein